VLDCEEQRLAVGIGTTQATYIVPTETASGNMGEECGAYGGKKKCVHGFGAENLEERADLQDQYINGRTIF